MRRGYRRLGELRGIPAIAEIIPGFEAVICYGVLGPAGMPPDVTAKTATPQEFAKLVSDDLARWAEVARTAGIKGE